MAVTRKRIEGNLAAIRSRIAAAAARSGRDAADVKIVAVTKSVDTETIRNLIDAGITALAENRVQQFVTRAEEINRYLQRRRNSLASPVEWHLIGHLQRNKVKSAVEISAMIHSVDSLRLAEEINERCEKMNRRLPVLLQVNCSQEEQKYGCAVGAAIHLGELMAQMKHIELSGLMTMGPMDGNPDGTRHAFVRLRELFEEMRHENIGGRDFRHLSMGMSGDYEIAVEQGATMVRIGSALFE